MAGDYPTEDELRRIEAWSIRSPDDCRALLAFVRSIWWAAEWGFRDSERTTGLLDEPVDRYHVSTGGWSGNEDIIEALRKNLVFWMMCWEQTRKGGHYIFDVTALRLGADEPEGEEG